jgi:uncharacterized protein (TIGR00299 family) protein
VIAWLDASAGASGDMLLGALLDAGVPLPVLQAAVDAVAPEPVTLTEEPVARGGLAATRCRVDVVDSTDRRGWDDIAGMLASSSLEDRVRRLAEVAFQRLADAEAAVHGIPVEEVHFHEVGALDAIADVVAVCAGFVHLDLGSVVVSPVAVGSGRASATHGNLPVPVPAVTRLLRGIPSYAGPGAGESCTPTGAALLTTLATSYGPQPPMAVEVVGTGAGGRDPSTHPNVVRLLLGQPVEEEAASEAVVLETNVDDLDPRLWPDVIRALLAAGASDAWLTPILMKKGRPAHTLSVLVTTGLLPAVRRVVFEQTSTIGVREVRYAKTALDRQIRLVAVAGHQVQVKLARLDGELMNVQPEYDDVAAVAAATGRPVRDLLAEATAVARGSFGPGADGVPRLL